MHRREMIGKSLSVAAGLGLPLPALPRGAGGTDQAATRYGRVRGRREDGIVKFLGVPYATPPLGDLRFARHGRPTAPGVPRWPAYARGDRATMWLDARCTIVNDPDRAERLYWDGRAASSDGARPSSSNGTRRG